jgi:hypothetical protein
MHSSRKRLVGLTVAATLALGTAPAYAVDVALPGSPLTVHVGDQGQMQAFRAGEPSGIFFSPSSTTGDAGFFLAFPDDGALPDQPYEGLVFGFDGAAGPGGLAGYTPVSQSPVTGSGALADPFTQTTVYTVGDDLDVVAEVTQTTTYVNGEQRFVTTWVVENSSAGPIAYKALAAADFYFEGSDVGTGVFTQGPPRFIGGTNADTGRSGGFVETGAPSPPWSAYQALAYGSAENEVWGKVEAAALSAAQSFDNTVVGEPVDNAGGVEWDGQTLAAGESRTYSLITRSALPAALQINPPNAGSPQGVPITFTATAKDTEGTPFAGKALRYTIVGVNPLSGTATIDAAGNATIVDPGTNAGADTVIAFVDLNNNGAREPAEPQASALGTFVDNVAPACKVSVSGDRPVAGGQGRPLVISVNCDSPATVTTATTFTVTVRRRAGTSALASAPRTRKKRIRLKPVSAVVAPGQATKVKIKVPKKVARKYAGKRLKATVRVTAVDAAGNKATAKTTKRVKLAKLKKKRG